MPKPNPLIVSFRDQNGKRPPFPHLVDNTIRSSFSRCGMKVFWGHIMKLAPQSPSVHLHAGGAFAHGLEIAKRAFYEAKKPEAESLRLGLQALINFYGPVEFAPTKTGDKSCDNVIRAYDSYFQRYGLGRDILKPYFAPNGKAMLEFTFAIPTEVMHPETGDPILYGGRADQIGIMSDALMVSDEKTASQLGEQWAQQWDLDSQFTGYVKAAMTYGFPVAGVVVRGVGLLKTKITHQEALVYRSGWVIDRWWDQLNRDIARMVYSWENEYWDYAISKDVCGAYGGCEFKMLCETQDPQGWIPMHYRHREWDPLAKDFGEKLLEQAGAQANMAPELDIGDLTKPSS